MTVLVAGKGVGDASQAASKVEGVQKVSIFIANYADCIIYSILLFIKRGIYVFCEQVLVADDATLERGLAEPTAALLAEVQKR